MKQPKYKCGSRVKITNQNLSGKVVSVNPCGSLKCYGIEPSYDVMTPDLLYKHIPESRLVALGF